MTRPSANILTVAGSDSSGGAGIQADLKTFTAFGAYGMSVITAITAQNTVGVQRAFELPLDLIAAQFDSVCTDIPPQAAKTGMLSSAPVVEMVARKLTEHQVDNIVVDPVMVAKSGHLLLTPEAKDAVVRHLLPLATVVTPNLYEAGFLTDKVLESLDDMLWAADQLHHMGARWVVIKGGHRPEAVESIDLLYGNHEAQELRAPRLPTKNTHGTGCTFSAAIAAGLGRGLPVPDAVALAKQYVTRAIEESLSLGKGQGPTNHMVDIESPWAK